MKQLHDVYIGIGSNLGARNANILRSVEMISKTAGIEYVELSSILETEPLGGIEQGPFLNAVLKIRTFLSPTELLSALLKIEIEMGRVRVQRWGPRLIDLDILYFGEEIVNTPGLKIPHPEIANRPFVLSGLRELRCPCGPRLSPG